MVHNELHAIDLGIIAAYLVAMVAIGVVVVKKVQSTDDYYLGGRSFGPLVLMATVCATIIGGSGLMGRAGVAYSSGFKAIMTALPYLLGMFIFSGFAGRISAVGTTFNVTSIPDLFEQRFGKTSKVILGCLIAFTMMGTVASQVTATATIINMLGNEIGISYEMGALIACAVFIIYTATSGLFGVIYTDVFQFVMLILFVYIMIPAASLSKLGGFSVFLENLAPELERIMFWLFLAGNALYYAVGIALAYGLKDNRAFCKYLCPVTVFLKPMSYFSLLRVHCDESKCAHCGKCLRVCPMDVEVNKESRKRKNGTECILCYECTKSCPTKALR